MGHDMFEEIHHHLEDRGLRIREGTIMEATIIETPSSTKDHPERRRKLELRACQSWGSESRRRR